VPVKLIEMPTRACTALAKRTDLLCTINFETEHISGLLDKFDKIQLPLPCLRKVQAFLACPKNGKGEEAEKRGSLAPLLRAGCSYQPRFPLFFLLVIFYQFSESTNKLSKN
jgi:hypothetical protein